MIPIRKHLTTPTLYIEQATQEYDTIDVYYLNVFGYKAPFGKPWYDILSGWYVLHSNEDYVTLSKYPILPPRKGWGSRVFWLLSFFKRNHCNLCRQRADIMDVTYVSYQQVIDWFNQSSPPGNKVRDIFIGVFLLCVEVSLLKFNVLIKNRLSELLVIVMSLVTSTNVRSTMN